MRGPTTLLAKSRHGNRELPLERHLRDTEDAARQIFRLDGRWGQNWCRFFKLNSSQKQEQFLLNLRLAALFHDIGKANKDFYRAVTSGSQFVLQTLRHEHISALILCLAEVRKWLKQNSVLDIDVLTAAVLSHHLKAAEGGEEYTAKGWKWCHPRGNHDSFELYLQHPEVEVTLSRVAELADLTGRPLLNFSRWSPAEAWARTAWGDGTTAARTFRREVRRDKSRLSLLLAVKAGVIVADSAASGLFRENHKLEEWIEDVVHDEAIGYDEVADAILTPRARQISSRGNTFTLRPFQKTTAEQGPRVLLLAACAAGKTIAAWKWAEAQARDRKLGKVVFLYPTRGTATEGFRDYVGWAPEAEGALVHATSRYELEAMRSNPSEAMSGKSYDSLNEDQDRLFALGLWSRRYFSATVDQFLSFIEHNYKSLCLLPVLADAAVIIDEVHSFDIRMFDCLIAFLKNFDVPVLCMTATLPPDRRQQLVEAGLKYYNASEDSELHQLESHPRYRLEPVATVEEAMRHAIAAFRNGERVLWVVNRVTESQRLAQDLEATLGVGVLSYHSRFCLKDRKDIHAATIAAFQQKDAPAIAVTTQVCEMSLDLDADVLISEIAPIPSLVQRFGRANRHLARGLDFRARLLTYAPSTFAPYRKEDHQEASAFLSGLRGGDLSQRQLAEALERHETGEPSANGSARFLESGYYAVRGDFRDIDDFALPCVLTTDLDQLRELVRRHETYDGYVVNVPKSHVLQYSDEERPKWLPKYLGVADGNSYSRERGFLTE